MDSSPPGDAVQGGIDFRIRDQGFAPQSREAILVSTLEVIAERGFESTRFSDISEACGVSIGSLQYQFGSREDMVHAAFQYLAFQELREMAVAMRAGSDPWAQLLHLMDISMMENEDSEIVWRAWVEFWRSAIRDLRIREMALEAYGQWHGFVEQLLRKGQEQGRFQLELDYRATALQISAVVDGFSVPLVLQDPGLREIRSTVTEAVVKAVERIVGLQPV